MRTFDEQLQDLETRTYSDRLPGQPPHPLMVIAIYETKRKAHALCRTEWSTDP